VYARKTGLPISSCRRRPVSIGIEATTEALGASVMGKDCSETSDRWNPVAFSPEPAPRASRVLSVAHEVLWPLGIHGGHSGSWAAMTVLTRNWY